MDVNLENASLEGADLEGSYLSGANIRNTNVKNSRGFPARVANAILDAATYGKSEWMPQTLVKWHHAGCKILALDELPRDAIAAVLTGFAAVLPPEVLISYGGCDSEVAMMMATHLEGRGIRVFFAGWDIDYGEDIVRTLEEAIERAKVFLIV
jgi:uncharacterized protein YjbI with pentapeptide repeats